ncbi:TPA: hypothetical protein U1366_000341 [Streptococcus suis]|nr:hypothetical protein [Streptococcus suis]
MGAFLFFTFAICYLVGIIAITIAFKFFRRKAEGNNDIEALQKNVTYRKMVVYFRYTGRGCYVLP